MNVFLTEYPIWFSNDTTPLLHTHSAPAVATDPSPLYAELYLIFDIVERISTAADLMDDGPLAVAVPYDMGGLPSNGCHPYLELGLLGRGIDDDASMNSR